MQRRHHLISRPFRAIAVGAFPFALASAVACGSSSDGGDSGGTSGADGSDDPALGAGGGNGAGQDYRGLAECDATCEEGTYCSYSGDCVSVDSCNVDADCGQGRLCEDGACAGECGDQAFELSSTPPNVLVVLDRSCSMPLCSKYDHLTHDDNCWNRQGQDKWADSVNVISGLIGDFGERVRWGLELYPDADGLHRTNYKACLSKVNECQTEAVACTQEEEQIPPGAANGDTIVELLQSALSPGDPYFPDGPCVTNTYGVMQKVAEMQELKDQQRDNYVILITDGKEAWCAGDRDKNDEEANKVNIDLTETLIQEMSDAGLPTIVIGFSSEKEKKALEDLNGFAIAGGLPNPEEGDDYYPVSNAAQLKQSLNGIIGGIVSCEFRLDEKPVNPNKLYVFFDDEQISQGETEGWTYNSDTNSIIFAGDSCTQVKSGAVEIDVAFGCDGVPVGLR